LLFKQLYETIVLTAENVNARHARNVTFGLARFRHRARPSQKLLRRADGGERVRPNDFQEQVRSVP
jgi:hypothetical protein